MQVKRFSKNEQYLQNLLMNASPIGESLNLHCLAAEVKESRLQNSQGIRKRNLHIHIKLQTI